MEGILIVILLISLGFIGFCVYFIFKILQFVIQAINLYKDMVVRIDVIIKLLHTSDTRIDTIIKLLQPSEKAKNSTLERDSKAKSSSSEDRGQNKIDMAKLEKQKTLKKAEAFKESKKIIASGKCPECGESIDGDEVMCLECGFDFSEFID